MSMSTSSRSVNDMASLLWKVGGHCFSVPGHRTRRSPNLLLFPVYEGKSPVPMIRPSYLLGCLVRQELYGQTGLLDEVPVSTTLFSLI